MSTTPQQEYQPGDVADGHVLTQDGQWIPTGAAPGMPYAVPPVPQQRPKNGLAIAALVLGIVGLVFCLIPILGFIAIPLGALALIFGIIGIVRKRKGTATAGGMAIAGTIAGLVALVVGIIGVAIVSDAVNDVDEALDTAATTQTVEGEAFTHDGYTADKGWTITKDPMGDPTIKGLSVTNDSHEASFDETTDSPMFTITLMDGKKNVGEIECTGGEIGSGESTQMDCISMTSGNWQNYSTIKVDDML